MTTGLNALDANNRPPSEIDDPRMHVNRTELIERIAAGISDDGYTEPFPGFFLFRRSARPETGHSTLKPSLCVIAQGSKEIFIGDSCFRYDPFHYLLATIELPAVSRVIDASADRPFLALRLELPSPIVSSVMTEAGYDVQASGAYARAMDVSPLDVNLLDATVRLVRLLESPEDVQVLLPLILREIVYRLLMGDQGARLRHMAVLGGYTPTITQASHHIRQHFDQALDIKRLAREFGMSVSSFHHHFKAVTGMSPLQFQKQFRLQEAQRLMLSENMDASGAAYRVGYKDVSHFNREYKRVFGNPPMRDVQQLRDTESGVKGK
jgi:AraC-like DNA-binding protein